MGEMREEEEVSGVVAVVKVAVAWVEAASVAEASEEAVWAAAARAEAALVAVARAAEAMGAEVRVVVTGRVAGKAGAEAAAEALVGEFFAVQVFASAIHWTPLQTRQRPEAE